MKNWLKNFAVAIVIGCILIFLIVWIIYTFLILRSDPELSNIYVAIGTLILAGATGLLAFLTWLNIQSSIERENRNSKLELQRLALERIRSWAEETFEKISQRQGHGFQRVRPAAYVLQERLLTIKLELLSSHVKSIGIETEAKQLTGDITNEVILAIQILSKYIGRLGMLEDIEEFKEFIGDTSGENKLEPFTDLEEVTIAENEVLDQLKKVINCVTKEIVPTK